MCATVLYPSCSQAACMAFMKASISDLHVHVRCSLCVVGFPMHAQAAYACTGLLLIMAVVSYAP